MNRSILAGMLVLVSVMGVLDARAQTFYPSTTGSSLTVDLDFGGHVISNIADIKAKKPVVDVRAYGATGNGTTDDTAAIQSAINAAARGTVVYFPTGQYLLSSSLSVTKILHFRGDGLGTQLYQSNTSQSMFVIGGDSCALQAMTMNGFYLGSAATTSGTALLYLNNVHRSRFDNIIMAGSYYGVYLHGCICNTFVDLKSCTGIGNYSKACSANQYWVYLDKNTTTAIASNANRFYNPLLEGCQNGLYFDGAGQGGLSIYGGTFEGMRSTGTTALNIQNNQTPVIVSGVHFESNAQDINTTASNNVLIEGICGNNVQICSGTATGKNTRITDSYIENITIFNPASGVCLENVKFNSSGTGTIQDHASDTELNNIVNAGSGGMTYGTFGGRKKKDIVVNGDQENWTGGLPIPFTAYGYSLGNPTVTQTGVGLADTTKHSGRYATKVMGTAEACNGLRYDLPSTVAGQWITVEAWVYAASGTPKIGILLNGLPWNYYLPGTGSTGVWEKLVVSFSQYSQTYSSGSVLLATPNGAIVYWDDVKVYVSDAPPPYGIIVPITAGTTSVSVAKNLYLTDVFQTANTSATTITNFLNGYTGQKITLNFTDSNTTIANTGNIKTAGAFTSTPYNTMTFLFDGTNWCETSRSVNQ